MLFKSAGIIHLFFPAAIIRGALAAIYVDGIYVGEYDFSNGKANVPSGPTVQMNCLYLDAGIHEVYTFNRLN